MKAMLITIKPQYACQIMNGDKTIEVRKNTALAKGIKKLIAEYGKARIYVAVSKDPKYVLYKCLGIGYDYDYWKVLENRDNDERILNGKVAFMFECEKVEDIICSFLGFSFARFDTPTLNNEQLEKSSCLSNNQLYDYLTKDGCYLGKKYGYAIHISNLMIFDKPKEIGEFKHFKQFQIYNMKTNMKVSLTKAPQNFCCIEGDE